MLRSLLVFVLLIGIASPTFADNFKVEFRNLTSRKVRVKTVKFDNAPPVTLNNGNGLDLNKQNQNGDKQSAFYSGDGNRVIIFWDVTSKEVLATRSEDFNDDFNAFVALQPHPTQPGNFLIAIGALP